MPYLIVWGIGDDETGRDTFPTLDAVRGMLAHDTDMTPEMVEAFISTGKAEDPEDDPAGSTQFDHAWIRLEVIS